MSLSVSIVSHGHGEQLRRLIQLLTQTPAGIITRVWVTLNIPELGLFDWLTQTARSIGGGPVGIELHIIQNPAPLGFGSNHNQAFEFEMAASQPATWFCVMNPDVFWHNNPFCALIAAGAHPKVACIYPRQVTSAGLPQDHQRTLLTPSSLVRRRLLGQVDPVTHIDWVCGAFMLLRTSAYRTVHGFDQRYHLYCEDVDLCLRLQLDGHVLVEAPGACIVHDAHRNSLRQPRHFAWHVRSLLRLWGSDAYRRYRHRQAELARQF